MVLDRVFWKGAKSALLTVGAYEVQGNITWDIPQRSFPACCPTGSCPLTPYLRWPALCRAVRSVTPEQVEEMLAAVARLRRANLRNPHVCAASAVREISRMVRVWEEG